MAWHVLKVHSSPIQSSVTLVNDDAAAVATTEWREADKLARATITAATLNAKGYGITGRATRTYVSQCY